MINRIVTTFQGRHQAHFSIKGVHFSVGSGCWGIKDTETFHDLLMPINQSVTFLDWVEFSLPRYLLFKFLEL